MLKSIGTISVCMMMCGAILTPTVWAEGNPPLINRTLGIDENIFKVTGEIRHRMEIRRNLDLTDARDDRDTFHLLRTRLNLDWTPADWFEIFVQLQDARDFDRRGAHHNPSFEDSLDFRQVFVKFDDFGLDGVSLKAGRQELAFGGERLVGPGAWINTSRPFDAVRLTYEQDDITVDGFWSRVVEIDSDEFNELNSDDDFAGVYGQFRHFSPHVLDLYYFYRNSHARSFGPRVGRARMEKHTVGVRLSGNKLYPNDWGAWDYSAEGAYQCGDFGRLDIEAFMIAGIIGFTWDHPYEPRVAFEYDYASGDSDTSDNRIV